MRESILHTLLFTPISQDRWGLPMLFWGPPGIGKSAIIEDYCRRWGLYCETLSPGERGEGAFGVTPVPFERDAKTFLSYPPPDWLEKMSNGGVVFLDEMTCAEPSLQKPMLGILQARRIGSTFLGNRVRVFGAANATDLATGGWDITPAVANRLGHWDWEQPTADEWSEWLMSGVDTKAKADGDAQVEEKRVLKAWPVPWAKACGIVTGFVKRRADLLHNMPTADNPDLSKAWPSHRSWENATRAMASAEVHGLDQVAKEALLTAFIGKGAADELCRWLEAADLPDPAAILDGKEVFVADVKRLDRTMAVYSSCAALVAPANAANRKERAAALWRLLDAGKNVAIDVIVPAATALVRGQLMVMAEARPVLAKLAPVLRLADYR